MRLTSVVMHSPNLEDVELSLRERSKDRYMIRSIVGIDAEEITPKFYGHGLISGASFYEYAMKPRDVVMRITLSPQFQINEDVSSIRDELYRLISSNRTGRLQLQFKAGPTTVSVLNGMITKFEVAYFNQMPELQITVSCPDPIFRSIHPTDWDLADLPSANPVVLPDNSSTAPHGFSFKVEFTATTPSFVIQDAPSSPDWKFTVTPTGGFAIGDELHFSSEYGARLVYHERAVNPQHIMDKVITGSVWPTIFPGNNRLYFMQIANFDWLELTYNSAYWGV